MAPKTTKKTAAPETVVEPVSAPAPVETPVAETMTEITPLDALRDQGHYIMAKLASIRTEIKELESSVKDYTRDMERMMKTLSKAKGGRRKGANAGKVPSGFVKKTKVTDAFEKFMRDAEVSKIVATLTEEESKKESTSFAAIDDQGMISRPSATKVVTAYIKAKSLQDPNSKRNFKPDAKLKKLLTPLTAEDTAKGGYSFFNLQRYMSHLYVKA